MLPGAMKAQTMSAAAASPARSAGGTSSCGEATGPTACGASGPASKNDRTVNVGGGNPVNVITGNKYQREVDLPALPGVLGLELVRHYNSQFSGVGFPNGIMGRGWKLSYETELHVVGRALQIVQADGARLIFSRDLLDPSRCSTSRASDGRIAIRRGPRSEEYVWTWPDGRRLSFDHRGKLVQIAVPTGEFVTLQHDAGGHLVQVTDPQGRQLKLNYAEPARDGRRPAHFTGVQSIDTPAGRFAYEYGSTPPKGTRIDKIQLAANLAKVHLPTHYDADKPAHPLTARGTTTSSVSRTYHYEDARFPTLLTGISVSGSGSDGKPLNQRISTYGYDQRGWAVRSEHGGLKVEMAVLERASLSELPGSMPGLSVLVHGRTTERPDGRRLEIRSAMVAGDYRITETRGEPCVAALPCPRANMRYVYDAKGLLTEEIQLDLQGRPLRGVRTSYDPLDRVLRVSQVAYKDGKPGPEHWMVRYEYGASGGQPALVAKPSVVPGREHQKRLTYNDRGQVLSIEESGYSPLDAQGLPVIEPSQASPIKRITRYEYSHINGRSVLVAVDGPLPGPADTTRYVWDRRADHLRSVQAPGDHAMKVLQRDTAGRVTLVAHDDGSRYRETSTRHDPAGRVLARDMVAWSRQDGVLSQESRLSQHAGYDHDAHGRLVAIHGADGTRVRTEFDAHGRPGTLILPDGGRIALQRDAGGALLAVTRLDAQQRALQTVRFDRDGAQRLTGMSDDLGQMLTLRYAPGANRPVEAEHPGAVKTAYAYDELGFITEQVRAAGTELELRTRWQHDPAGHVTSIERASRQTALYDDFGRKLFQADAQHGAARYVWDEADRLIARVNVSGQVQRYEYDAAGRLTASGVGDRTALTRSRHDGSLVIETAAFDAQGRARERKQWRHDSLGRLVEERHWLPPETGAGTKGEPLLFVTLLRYDERGRLIERTLVDAQQRAHRLAYAWDDTMGHLTGIRYNGEPVVRELQASWLGGIGAFTHGNGVSERFERDARGRLTRHTAMLAQRAMLDDRYRYDAGNHLVSATETTGAQPLRRRYGYDALGRLVSEQREGDRTPDTYAYDSEGNRVRATVGGETQRYAYAGQQLVAAEPTARQAGWASVYGALGEPWTFWELRGEGAAQPPADGQSDQPSQPGRAALLMLGKPAVRTVYAPAGPALAVLDGQDRPVARYGWGLRGERISKTTIAGDHRRTTYYLYQDGGSRPVVTDQRDQGLQLYAEADESGRVKRQYVYLDGRVVACIDTAFTDSVWERLRTVAWSWFGRVPQASGEVYAVHADQRHAPVAVSDAQGQVVWRARYEAFGLARIEASGKSHPARTASWRLLSEAHAANAAATFELNLRLPGQYWDAERGVHHNLQRDYDPQTGRFTTADPISMRPDLDLGMADRLAGGNVYAYVSNNPLTQVDAQGYYEEDIHYYMTFFLALAAGVDYNEARIIALATQYIDDNPDTRPLDPDNPAGSYLSDVPGAIDRLSKYHFTQAGHDPAREEYHPTPEERARAITAGYPDPGSVTYEDAAVYAGRRIENPRNPQLNRLMDAVQRAPTRCASLQFFGEYLHAFEDTFAHRDSKNQPISINLGLGHLFHIHEPDKTYNGWGVDASGVMQIPPSILPALVHYQTREARTLQMEKEVFAKLEAFKAPGGKAVSLSQLEPILRQFNAIKEDHGTGFGKKFNKLNDALKQFGITQPNGQAINLAKKEAGAYDVSQARKNRNEFMCDKDGKRLNQADYQGTILPKGTVPCK
jgi:RHS repeat-associated protein